MSEVVADIAKGQTWLNHVWGILILETRADAPAERLERYEREGASYVARLAKAPHAFCLVLYDFDKQWIEGSTLWIDYPYLVAHSNRET